MRVVNLGCSSLDLRHKLCLRSACFASDQTELIKMYEAHYHDLLTKRRNNGH